MGAMTLSMIRGEEGHQAKELERLVAWLAESEQPDLVHISTSMLIGVARRIRKALNVPVVCTLQDEDTWLDAVDPPYDARCWEAIRERAAEIDAFVAVSDAYARHMRGRLRIPDGRLNVVHVGIDLAGYTRTDLPFDPPVLGYLSKLTPSLGLGELVETFMRLKRKPGLERLQLRAIGGLTGNDTRFVEELRGRLAAAGMAQDASFKPEVDKPARLRFLSGITVMCVPMPQGEAFGTFMVEAWASGVPVVQPDAGAFPELIALTGGGVTYDPAGPEALDGALESLLRDPDRARALGLAGREKTPSLFSIDVMARKIEKVYHETLKHRNKEERS
jgi:glycosyltransferase involved in cell wall biosynthesis